MSANGETFRRTHAQDIESEADLISRQAQVQRSEGLVLNRAKPLIQKQNMAPFQLPGTAIQG
jgi:hypothetical protein